MQFKKESYHMEKSLFIPLRNEGLTTMKIRYDFKTGLVKL